MPRHSPIATEREEQGAVLQFIAAAMPGAVVLHIPNESPAGEGWRRRMIADGVLPGAPDLFVSQHDPTKPIAADASPYVGARPCLVAFLEMKRPGWVPAKPGTKRAEHEERQRETRDRIAATGVPVGVATTLEEAVAFLRSVGFHIIARESAP